MRRDPDLIRKLLFHFDEKPDYTAERCPAIEGYSDVDILYHMLLLAQAGFLDHQPEWTTSRDRIIRVLGFGLTWDGHEFLEAARDDNRWQRVKQQVIGTSGGLLFDLLKTWLKQEGMKHLPLSE